MNTVIPPSTTRVFFYGSFINRQVLARGGLDVQRLETARLGGFDIRIETLATLVRSDEHCVYGVIAEVAHPTLARLYSQSWLGNAYVPEAVVVETPDSRLVPALCFIAHVRPPTRPAEDYLDWIVSAARELNFPAWYLDRLVRAGAATR